MKVAHGNRIRLQEAARRPDDGTAIDARTIPSARRTKSTHLIRGAVHKQGNIAPLYQSLNGKALIGSLHKRELKTFPNAGRPG